MPAFWNLFSSRNSHAPDSRKVPAVQTYKFQQVSHQRDSILLKTDSREALEYLARNLDAYQYILSSDGNSVPEFEYSTDQEKLEIRITGDLAGVIAWLNKDGLLTRNCARQCERLDLPPSPFLQMEQGARQAIICH